MVAIAFAAAAPARAEDPSTLWKIVHGKCVPNEQAHKNPAPCAVVDIKHGVSKGWVALKDIYATAQYLVIPTARIPGIEDPVLLAPNATNYFAAAWQERALTEARLPTSVPRDMLSLAINSTYGRTQNQLHIHIDCIRADVRAALAANLDKVGDTWTAFPVPLAGHSYRAIRIPHPTLEHANPFHILADKDPTAAADMGKHTLVVAPVTFSDSGEGFVLLDDKADLAAGDVASGETLQDHACKIVLP